MSLRSRARQGANLARVAWARGRFGDVDTSSGRGLRAVNDSNAFIYAKCYVFLIESDPRVLEAYRLQELGAKEDAVEAGRLC